MKKLVNAFLKLVAVSDRCMRTLVVLLVAPVACLASTVATPTFSPAAGTYTSTQTVTISDSTSGATIHYTTNGSTPTTSSPTYTSPITVSTTETVKAIGTKSGWTQSAVGSATYTINLAAATPTFSPVAGTYTGAQTVTISDSTSGASIYYTTNGSTPTTSSTHYSGPISVSASETVKAIATASGYSQSAVGSAAYILVATTPSFSPGAGTYSTSQSVTISDSTPGSSIYYTTNGSTPTTSSTHYTSPIAVNSNETVKAIAAATGYSNSAVGSAAYSFAAAVPTFTPGTGSYSSSQSVTIGDATSGASIYYTTDGSTPTTSSTRYSAPISVTSTETIKAIAAASGYSNSSVGAAVYTMTTPTAPTPTLSPTSGTYAYSTTGTAVVVTLSDTAQGATIYYTTDGSTPTTASSIYYGPISISQTTTVKTIAVLSGYSTSSVGSGTYTVQAEAPSFELAVGSYVGSQSATLYDNMGSARIYYTTDGSTPTTSSARYSTPLTVSSTETIKAIATYSGYATSPVSSAAYTITSVPAVPTITPAAGNYSGTQLVTVTDSSLNATIYFTVTPGTTGTTPTSSSSSYTGALTIGTTQTIEAIAGVSGYTSSSAASATYTIGSAGATTTTLALTSGGSPTTSITIGSAVTLTASVMASGSPVSGGTVIFCDANAAHCTDIHALGAAQVTSSGTATLNLRPGVGTFSYKAVYRGTQAFLASTSSTAPLTVSGEEPSFTSISLNQQGQTLSTTTWAMGNQSTSPTGTMLFTDVSNGNTQIGSATLSPQSGSSLLLAQPQVVPLPGTIHAVNSLVTTGDFNEDGKLDVATITVSGVGSPGVAVMLGNGDGTFSGSGGYLVSGGGYIIAAGDFNNDGHLDLVVAGQSTLSILLGHGDGGFSAPISAIGSPCIGPAALTVADFNRDGKLDIAEACASTFFGGSNAVLVLEGNGDGTFIQATGSVSTPATPSSITAGDFNNDGKLDLAVSDGGGNITILLGNGDGTFTQPSGSPISVPSELQTIVAGDFNEDGNLDLAVADLYYGSVVTLLGNGDGTFPTQASLSNGKVATYSLALGDFNGDGHVDIAAIFDPSSLSQCQISCSYPNAVTWFLGNGAGGFWSPSIITPQGQPQSLVTGDFNGDGLSDLAVLNYNAYGPMAGLAIILGNTGASATASMAIPSGTNVTDAFVASYSGDSAFQASNSAVSPSLESIAPSQGVIGQVVKLIGSFGSTIPTVTFNGVNATVNGWSGAEVEAVVPAGAASGPVVVSVNGFPSASLQFTLASGPVITTLDPSFGIPGSNVTISGYNFDSAATVTFNGVSAPVVGWNINSIVATIPPWATSGPVVISDDGLQSNSYNFSVGATISSLNPYVGVVGTQVTIAGSGFGGTQGSSTVTFNGVPAVSSGWSNTSITAGVPSNATSGDIAVQVGGITTVGPVFTISPIIAGLLPSSGPVGTQVTITGQNFGVTQGSSSLAFGSVAATPTSWATDRIIASVPSGAVTGPVAVTVSGQTSNGVTFNLSGSTSTGTISGTVTNGSTPISGATITVMGNGSVATATSNSSGNYTVANLTAATYNVVASAFAYSIGTQSNVTVTSGGTNTVNFALSNQTTIAYAYDEDNRLVGVSSSSQGGAGYAYDPVGNILSIATYTPGQVAVFGFSPVSGSVGTTVTISGTSFGATTAQNTVKFGTITATVVSATPTQLVVTVPSGAATGTISVTAPDGTATSGSSFSVTMSFYSAPFRVPGSQTETSPVELAFGGSLSGSIGTVEKSRFAALGALSSQSAPGLSAFMPGGRFAPYPISVHSSCGRARTRRFAQPSGEGHEVLSTVQTGTAEPRPEVLCNPLAEFLPDRVNRMSVPVYPD